MSAYDVIYMLKPIKETEPGWWKLKWKPIFKQTYSIYFSSHYNSWGFGIDAYEAGAHNGWNRSYDNFIFRIRFWNYSINFWVKWNFIVHEDGPSDMNEKRPLTIPPNKSGVMDE